MSLANPDYKPEAALGFDHLKSIQTIAYFIRKSGESAEKLKLIKLVYLADRLSFKRRGKPINFDSYFSLPHGPVASTALNGMDQNLSEPAWKVLTMAENRKDITIDGEVSDDYLSRADRLILDDTWDQFGGMTSSQIRNWTHKHCAEYVEVGPAKSLPIDLSEILTQVGARNPDNAARDIRVLQTEVGRLERLRAA